MIFELYPKGWVGFHQADRRGGWRIPSRGNSMCKGLDVERAGYFGGKVRISGTAWLECEITAGKNLGRKWKI